MNCSYLVLTCFFLQRRVLELKWMLQCTVRFCINFVRNDYIKIGISSSLCTFPPCGGGELLGMLCSSKLLSTRLITMSRSLRLASLEAPSEEGTVGAPRRGWRFVVRVWSGRDRSARGTRNELPSVGFRKYSATIYYYVFNYMLEYNY